MMTATTEHAMGAIPEAAATGENGVRAALYGVFAHLFADRPSAELLERIAEADQMIVAEDSALAVAVCRRRFSKPGRGCCRIRRAVCQHQPAARVAVCLQLYVRPPAWPDACGVA
jgi:hypothetical protein